MTTHEFQNPHAYAFEYHDIRPEQLSSYWHTVWHKLTVGLVEAGQHREHAEAEALREVLVRMAGLTALNAEIGEQP